MCVCVCIYIYIYIYSYYAMEITEELVMVYLE